MLTQEEKNLVKDIIDTYTGLTNLNFFIEHNIGNKDVVLGINYEGVDEDLDTFLVDDYETIREDEKDVKFAEELYWYIRENVNMDEIESILMFTREG